MSNKYTAGLDQRYIQNFQGKDDDGNVKGSFGSADRSRYDAYARATQGLDKDLAFKALDGGMTFGANDRARYDKLVSDRNAAAAAKAKAQAHQKSIKKPKDKTSKSRSNLEKMPEVRPDKKKAPSKAVTDGSQKQDVTQDNDINTNINGDNNLVNNNQDNSIRQYGGNTKTFIYNGNANGNIYASPVSAGTMGGFFHDEDSPGSSASFIDRYNTMNRDNQKRYKNLGIAQTSIHNAKRNEAINFGNLDQRIQDRSKATRARSTTMAGEIFGDMFNFKPQEFKSPEAPDPIKKPSFM